MSMDQPLPLFDDTATPRDPSPRWITEGVLFLPGFADGAAIAQIVGTVADAAPFRHMQTPGGQRMSAAMTNCGPLGWVSDTRGYRYSPTDPESGKAWPALPKALEVLAVNAAAVAGFPDFHPDACLINRYAPGTRMGLHQDRDEVDFSNPIVTLSLGLPGTFQLAGHQRRGPYTDILMMDGDVLVMGGPARLFYHGVRPVKPGRHPHAGDSRISLTFRRASV